MLIRFVCSNIFFLHHSFNSIRNYDMNDNTTMSSLAVTFVKCEIFWREMRFSFSHILFFFSSDVKLVMSGITTAATVVIVAAFVLCLMASVSSAAADCFSSEEMRIFYKENVCHLHKQTGSCKLKWKRFHYNRLSGSCEPFIYEGEI